MGLNETWRNPQKAAFKAIGTGEPCDTRLAMWESHLEAETIIAESLTSNPNAAVTPAPDPGPHYTIEREALPAA